MKQQCRILAELDAMQAEVEALRCLRAGQARPATEFDRRASLLS